MEGADGWWTKDIKRLKACPFIDFPPDSLLHTLTPHHIPFIYVNSSHGNLFCVTGGAV